MSNVSFRYAIEALGFKNMGWHGLNDVLEVVRQLDVMNYGIFVGPQKPADNIYCFELEDCLYMGKSGGKKDSLTYDAKHGKNGKGRWKSAPENRWVRHKSEILKAINGESTNAQYNLLAKFLQEHPTYRVWVNIIAPDANEQPSKGRNRVIDVGFIEKVILMEYFSEWFRTPLIDLEHRNHSPKYKKNSINRKVAEQAGRLPI